MRFAYLCLIVVFAIGAGTGCFRTKIRSGPFVAGEPTHQHRQWFTAAGLVSLTDPAGDECGERGIAYADSRHAVLDYLLHAVIVMGSAGLGASFCDDSDPQEYAACVSVSGSIGGLLVNSRTVTYRCR